MQKNARGTILVVDDEPPVLKAVHRILEAGGFEVIACADAERALELLSLVPVDLVLCDLKMPLPDGRQLVCEAVTAPRRVPVLVMTGHHDLREVWQLLGGARPAAVIPKPFDSSELLDVVARAIGDGAAAPPPSSDAVETRELAESMARALGLRDVETHAHARRVALWTRRLAIDLRLDPTEIFWCEIGALLHDVGKIGVPDAILRKPGKLDAAEWEVMRAHPRLGHDLLGPIRRLAPARSIVLHHHERWDGRGYPIGLAGEAIPRGARIFALVDAYDAMTSDRPYRAALSHDVATRRIVEESGRQFDPAVVAAFCAIGEAEWCVVRHQLRDEGSADDARAGAIATAAE